VFSPKACLYINAVLEDFVHMSSLLSILNRRMGAVAELRPPKPARIRRDGRVSHEGGMGQDCLPARSLHSSNSLKGSTVRCESDFRPPSKG
jgi:hypothetical protein